MGIRSCAALAALFALHKVNGNRGEPAGRLALGIIPFAGLHDVVLLFGCEMKLMVAQFGIRVGRVAQAVLAAQFHFDLPVDLVNRLFLGELKEAPTGLAGDLCQDFLAVRPVLRESLWITSAARSSPTPAAVGTAAINSARAAESAVAVLLLLHKEDRVDNRVGPLRSLDGVLEALLASAVHSVREDDQRLPALLFVDHFVRSQKNRVVECRASSDPPRVSAATSPTWISATAWISATTSVTGAGIVVRLLCGLQQLERGLQFLVRRGQILEKFHVAIEVDQEGPVLAFAQRVIEKAL